MKTFWDMKTLINLYHLKKQPNIIKQHIKTCSLATIITKRLFSVTRLASTTLWITSHVTILILMAATPSAVADSQLLDKIIAIVNDDVVLSSELEQRLQQVIANINKTGKQSPPIKKLQKEVLNQLILENIQLQMARRAGVRISDSQLNESMSRIAQQNNLTLPQFKKALEKDGLSYRATREQVQKEMTLRRVQQGSVNQRVQITDQEIANFLDSEEGQALTAPEYRVLHTLIPLTSSSSSSVKAETKQFANELYQRINNGESYQQVIKSANRSLKSSDLGWRKAVDLPSLVAELVPNLKKDQTNPPILSASGYHLVKLIAKRGGGELIPQTKARHILLKTSAIRNDAATKTEIESLRQRVVDGEDFADLAREHSEDIGSALEGGDLDWTNPGQLVGVFQKTMDKTDIDEISPAFRSQFGWHILQVLQRRNKDVTNDIRRNIASNHIHRRKFDDELLTWFQKIRDEAYVDIK